MKVTALDTTVIEIPLAQRAVTAIHDMVSVGCVLVELRTDEGVTGEGLVFTLNGARIRALEEMIRGLAPLVEGRDPHEVEGIAADVWVEINPTGHAGVTVAALSAVDTACWDAVGRAAGLPLQRMWGACRDEIDTYSSSGLWLSTTLDELVERGRNLVGQGFTGVKLGVGSPDPARDVERVRVWRDALGPDIALRVDANQGLTPKAAIRLGRMLEEFDLVWFEEPVASADLVGHAEVRSALDLDIATGETEYSRFGMQAIIDARACDVLMPDLQRVGGYGEFRASAHAASARHLPVSSHFFTEYSLALAGSLRNCVSVEHIDWFSPLFEEAIELRNGRAVIPDRPGHGFRFDRDFVAAHRSS